jgi:hypothetical protein
MHTIGIRLPAAEMATELAAMRKWLAEHGYEPAKFSYNRYGNTVSVYLTFEEEAAAKAFRSRLDSQQRHRPSEGTWSCSTIVGSSTSMGAVPA